MRKVKKIIQGFYVKGLLPVGFSIPEILISIYIISMGLLGVFSLVHQNIQVQHVNKNIMIASHLAQEGLELVRNTRDTNWLDWGFSWDYGAGPFTGSDIKQDGDYRIDYINGIDNNAVSNDGDITDDPDTRLYLNGNGFYTHDDGGGVSTSTLFYRIITTADHTAVSMSVSCLIQWRERGGLQSYVVDTVLYDWR